MNSMLIRRDLNPNFHFFLMFPCALCVCASRVCIPRMFQEQKHTAQQSTHNTLNAHCCSVCDFTRISSLILDLFIFCFCRHSTQPINDDHDDDGDDADSLLPIDKKYLKLNCADEREPEKANWRISLRAAAVCTLDFVILKPQMPYAVNG